MHARCGRFVLDELDQPVAEDHLARRDRDVFPDHERLGACRWPARREPLPVGEDVQKAGEEVRPTRRVRPS